MKFYRIRFEDGTYQSSSFTGWTKDKNKALMRKDRMEHVLSMFGDCKYTVEIIEVEFKDIIQVKFGVFDNVSYYRIFKETNKYIWAMSCNKEGDITYHQTLKLKKDHEGTVGLKSIGWKKAA